MRKMSKKGFTLVEIMIVVAIIGLLAAIAVPNFMRARAAAQAAAGEASRKQVESAVQVWAIDAGKNDTDAVTWGDIVPNYLRANPTNVALGATVGAAVTSK